ncbi:Gem-associated protein 5 [Phytophthora boehmeriae]|uniref:Gem-associated protein 5 n=1 Tax=Phytophthora boehmeriae TaxID=109152 RepID=A0A8T1X0A0_9STRA|nr:Gem-associated protein 5 [Phytophthora boehmeriae]
MALMLEHSGDAAQIEGAVPGPTPLRSTRSVHDKRHLRVLPPSANWYCSKVASNGEEQEAAKTSGSRVKVSFFAQLVRGKRDRRVTAVQFVTDSTGKLRLVCAGEEGSVQIWDVATRTMVEQHRKHKAEITAVTVSGILDANFVVAGDRQGRISVWERDAGKVAIFTPISVFATVLMGMTRKFNVLHGSNPP